MDKENQQVEAANLDSTSPKLKYRVAPDSAFLGKTVRIVITALNDTASNINFTDDDVIKITFPSSMVSSQSFSGSTPAKSGYVVAPTVGENSFSVTVAFNDIVIKPQSSLTITFDQVPIVNTAGPTSVGIVESIASVKTTTQLPFTIQPAGLGIIAWLDQLIIGQGQTTNLNWYTSGGTSVIVSNFPTGTGQKQFDVSDKMTSTPVFVPDGYQQWNYTATVYSSSTHVDQLVTLQQNPPMINDYTSVPAATQELGIDESAVLSWDTQFASSVILTTPAIPNSRQMIPAIPLTVSPGKDLQQAYKLNYGQLPATADYTLTVNGFKTPAVQVISFKIKPISLVYFKYADLAKTMIKYQTNPATNQYSTWQVMPAPNPAVSTFVINQPGAVKNTFYLGDSDKTNPQVQYFEAAKNNGKYDLNWLTANLASLVLMPGNISIQGAQIANGTYTVDTPGQYTLTGTTSGGLSITSILDVPA